MLTLLWFLQDSEARRPAVRSASGNKERRPSLSLVTERSGFRMWINSRFGISYVKGMILTGQQDARWKSLWAKLEIMWLGSLSNKNLPTEQGQYAAPDLILCAILFSRSRYGWCIFLSSCLAHTRRILQSHKSLTPVSRDKNVTTEKAMFSLQLQVVSFYDFWGGVFIADSFYAWHTTRRPLLMRIAMPNESHKHNNPAPGR
jgi:hypothetical protein